MNREALAAKTRLIDTTIALADAHNALPAAQGEAETAAAEAALAKAEREQAAAERVIDMMLSKALPERAPVSRDELTADIRERYTNPAAMRAFLSSEPWRAERCLSIATDPRGRFGLEPADTAAVIPTIHKFIA